MNPRIRFVFRILERITHAYTEKCLRNHIKSNRNQIVFITFVEWLGSKRTSVWIQINQKLVNAIWFRVDLIRLLNYFSVCMLCVSTGGKNRWPSGTASQVIGCWADNYRKGVINCLPTDFSRLNLCSVCMYYYLKKILKKL